MNTEARIVIGGRKIGNGHPPFIIAEMSGNHNGSLERALELVEAAAKAGAHALKIQTYTADTMTLDLSHGEFTINDEKSLWYGETLYRLYEKAHTPWDWHIPIFDRCKELGIICFSTAFDATAVEFLESLNVPAYKIASFENTDLPLIIEVASTGKPVFMSTGMASMAELEEAVGAARNAGCRDLILLKCTSTYPASPVDTNIATIPHMKDSFGCPVGLSDHTKGVGVAVASVTLGAVAIEKHFTLSQADGGVDSAFSLEPDEMKLLVEETERAWQSIGKITYSPTEKERESIKFRRTLYAVEDIKAGEQLTKNNIRAIRPGEGLPPKYIDIILGKKAVVDIKKGAPMRWPLFG